MSADLLRRAATVLRDSAKMASPGPWRMPAGQDIHDSEGVWVAETLLDAAWPRGFANAHYIATLHPGVGLALSEWLDFMAYLDESAHHAAANSTDGGHRPWLPHDHRQAMKVATAILGESTQDGPR